MKRWSLRVLEMLIAALFATVFSFFATKCVALLRKKPAPSEHQFNNTEIFLTSYFTAMLVYIFVHIFDWRNHI